VAHPEDALPDWGVGSGFVKDTSNNCRIELNLAYTYGRNGISHHSCGCKHDLSKKVLKCSNCKCAKANVPCSGGCCCKGACSNSLADNYAETGIFSRRASRMEEAGDAEGET